LLLLLAGINHMSSAVSEACAAMTAFGSGRVSLIYDEPGISLSVTAQLESGWFWCVYDRKANKIRGFGKATTAQIAVDAALRLLRVPQPMAAE
jgi:hypothetical protein